MWNMRLKNIVVVLFLFLICLGIYSNEVRAEEDVSSKKKQAYVIVVEDIEVAVATKEQAVEVLEEIKAEYDTKEEYYIALEADKKEKNVFEVKMFQSTRIETNVTKMKEPKYQKNENYSSIEMLFEPVVAVKIKQVEEKNILTSKQACELLKTPIQISEEYTIEQGDTLLSIAKKFEVTVAQLIAANPDWASTGGLKSGQKFVISGEKAKLSVASLIEVNYEVPSHMAMVEEYTNELYEGEERVVQENKAGKNYITATVTMVNGIEKERVITKTEQIEEAKAAIIQKGAKVKREYALPLSNILITSHFGERWETIHKGIDFACNEGTPVYASKTGVVTVSGWVEGYGYCILLSHEDGSQTRYAHLSQTQVNLGAQIVQGQQIALSGNTGYSTGPHLHFEIILPEIGAVNPYSYLFEN
jgi:Membrane proteins related to metalloendopeptidases